MSSSRGVGEPGCLHTNTHPSVAEGSAQAMWIIYTVGGAAARASQPRNTGVFPREAEIWGGAWRKWGAGLGRGVLRASAPRLKAFISEVTGSKAAHKGRNWAIFSRNPKALA